MPRSRVLRGLAVIALAGCAKGNAPPQAPAAADGEVSKSKEGDRLGELRGALAAREDQLRALGVALPAAPRDADDDDALAGAGAAAPQTPPTAATRADDAAAEAEAESQGADLAPRAPNTRCAAICDLRGAICDLEGSICGLATRHPGDPRYAALCARASDDCRAARGACDAC